MRREEERNIYAEVVSSRLGIVYLYEPAQHPDSLIAHLIPTSESNLRACLFVRVTVSRWENSCLVGESLVTP